MEQFTTGHIVLPFHVSLIFLFLIIFQDVSPGFVLCSPEDVCNTGRVFDAQVSLKLLFINRCKKATYDDHFVPVLSSHVETNGLSWPFIFSNTVVIFLIVKYIFQSLLFALMQLFFTF